MKGTKRGQWAPIVAALALAGTQAQAVSDADNCEAAKLKRAGQYSFCRLKAVHAVFNTACAPACTVLTCSCTAPETYWSSTSIAPFPGDAWFVNFAGGGVNSDGKSGNYFVRAVRGGS